MLRWLLAPDPEPPGAFTRWLAFVVLRLWVLMLLPAACYGLARVIALAPWPTAAGAALTGDLFFLVIQLLGTGWSGVVGNGAMALARVLTLGGGIALSAFAIRLGRGHAERAKGPGAPTQTRSVTLLVDNLAIAADQAVIQIEVNFHAADVNMRLCVALPAAARVQRCPRVIAVAECDQQPRTGAYLARQV